MMNETNTERQTSKRRAEIRNPKYLHCKVPEIVWILACIAIVTFVLLLIATPSSAMPEYATQLGEPCATCHISPAGGGLRTARGQAWVASEKPGAVPSIEETMKLLGVKTTVNPADYRAAPLPRPTPRPLGHAEGPSKNWHTWLSDYQGN